MPRIAVADLLNRLHQAAEHALEEADGNHTRVVSQSEGRHVDPMFKPYVDAFRANTGRVRIDEFLDAFDQYASYYVGQANVDGDEYLDVGEQDRLPALLKRNVAAVIGAEPVAPPPPVDNPPPVAGGGGAFGIGGVVAPERVRLTTILDNSLQNPSALAFSPRTGSLWIVNRGNDSSVVVDDPGTANQRVARFFDDSAHFMNNPTGIAFSRTRNEFATTQETTNDYNHEGHGNMFMGPTLWTADRRYFEGGTNSHIDMVHHSPMAMGIVAGEARANDEREYWVFNGHAGSIDRYFFNEPHERGGDDHHDGLTYRFAEGELSRVAGVPSGMALDENTGYLYIADTGNARIARLNTRTSMAAAEPIAGYHNETPLFGVPDTHVRGVTRADSGLVRPSGLILKDDKLVVADHATGKVKVFGTDGTLQGEVDTGLGRDSLTGIAEGPDGKLYALDASNERVVRIEIA